MKRSTYIKCCIPIVILILYQLAYIYGYGMIGAYNVISNILIIISVLLAYIGARVLYNNLNCKYEIQFFAFEVIALITSLMVTIYLGYYFRYIIAIVSASIVILNFVWFKCVTRMKANK